MKIYTVLYGRRNPDGWVVVPITTRDNPAPRHISVFDTEAEALAEASWFNALAEFVDFQRERLRSSVKDGEERHFFHAELLR